MITGMGRIEVIAKLRQRSQAIKAMGATSLYVFGSTIRDEGQAANDIDLFIDYDPNGRFNALDLVGIKKYLEDEFQLPVDVTTRDGLHPMLRAEIERTAVRVF
jgi:predicted nucleotidyltransferase